MKEDYIWARRCFNPAYVIEEDKLLKNLETLKKFSELTGVQILLALKGFANWNLFDRLQRNFDTATCSSINETQLALDYLTGKPHTYFVAYQDNDFDFLCKNSSHLTFNSVSQYQQFSSQLKRYTTTRFGIRINPEVSLVSTDFYNPCDENSRLGIRKKELDELYNHHKELPQEITGFHIHALCEDDGTQFVLLLKKIQNDYATYLSQIQWINFGGGHLITKKNYKTREVIQAIQSFKEIHPQLKIIIEPSSAFAWDIGVLITRVLDVVKGEKYDTAIINSSFTCYMPDCLEMPYQPEISIIISETNKQASHNKSLTPWVGAIGGLSCLAGDVIKNFKLEKPPQKGDIIIFKNMIHYTMVKSTQFNGIQHPDIILRKKNGEIFNLKSFHYKDYKNRF